MKVRRFAATVSYRGTRFSGWQRQAGEASVQGFLEEALADLFGAPVAVRASGRTDSGVHGLGQVVAFDARTRLSPGQVREALNSRLRPDVRLGKVAVAAPGFHPRFDAKAKTYRYLVAEEPSPFLEGFAWVVRGRLDPAAMKRAASFMTGVHDFSSFQGALRKAEDPVREIFRVTVKRERFTLDPSVRLIVIEVTGSGFLYKMVRTIAGTLVDAGMGKFPPEKVAEIIAGKDRSAASRTAPGHALYLKKVFYGEFRGARRT
jgi:tRNA pseudouridine38-40 synthase